MAERAGGWIGKPLTRREDVRFVTGHASYVDDLEAPDALHLGFVRSPFAHARVRPIDASGALALEGVIAVVTAANIAGQVDPYAIAAAEGSEVAPVPLPVLGAGTVRFVGEPVAAILAEERAVLEDATELVLVDYDALPTVGDPDEALVGGVRVHEDLPDNVLVRWERRGGDVEEAFAAADVVVRQRFHIPRLVAAPIEPRGAIARYDAREDLLTLWLSSQDPHRPLANLTRMLRRPADRIRVIVPDVGGAFGSKGPVAPEAVLAALLAIRTGRAVKWVETRSENFLAAYQGRGLDADVELAAAADGHVLGVRARLIADMGAYLQPTSAVPAITTGMLMCGTYAIPAAEVELVGVATNKVPVGPYRGAGRPEAALLVERMMDLLATELRIDPVELRHRNFIPPEAFPHQTPLGFVYDSGDYGRALRLACERIGYGEPAAGPVDASPLRGIGVAMYVERAGGGAAGPAGLGETAAVSVEPDGRILLRSGSNAHGQGHETTFAQIVADVFEIHPDDVEVRQGDSADSPEGVGSFASRSVTIGGSAALIAAERVRDRAAGVAALLLEVSPEDVRWSAGRAEVRGSPARSAGLADLAAYVAEGNELPPELRGGLAEEATFMLPGPVFPSGAYAADVEVERETGQVRVRRIVAVDDAGRVVNPLLAHGQVLGATVQGLGQSLMEEVVHDEAAQPMTTSFLQYAMPSTMEIPPIVVEAIETRSPFNPLGAKGIGEGGAIGTPAAVANAVCRALGPLGIRHLDVPFTPERVRTAIREAPP
ncbi:MAG: xanthine dehydrogenase family protein molybdopterin-binding subunit [Actinomycetota bacterium]